MGKNIASYFDRFGWTYVKGERYDLYYPGYWDAYPAFSVSSVAKSAMKW